MKKKNFGMLVVVFLLLISSASAQTSDRRFLRDLQDEVLTATALDAAVSDLSGYSEYSAVLSLRQVEGPFFLDPTLKGENIEIRAVIGLGAGVLIGTMVGGALFDDPPYMCPRSQFDDGCPISERTPIIPPSGSRTGYTIGGAIIGGVAGLVTALVTAKSNKVPTQLPGVNRRGINPTYSRSFSGSGSIRF